MAEARVRIVAMEWIIGVDYGGSAVQEKNIHWRNLEELAMDLPTLAVTTTGGNPYRSPELASGFMTRTDPQLTANRDGTLAHQAQTAQGTVQHPHLDGLFVAVVGQMGGDSVAAASRRRSSLGTGLGEG
jgi:hypothetical protein